MTDLLSTSTKIEKSNKSGKGYITKIQYLSPASESGYQLCPFRTPACEAACLGHSSGLMTTSTSKAARIKRTRLLYQDRPEYARQIRREIGALVRKADREGLVPTVRLNGDSDICWEKMKFNGQTLMQIFPQVMYYDYTKWPKYRQNLPANYHLTFSRSELTTDAEIQAQLDSGRNVAVVFDSVPTSWKGWRVVDGDKDDLIFLQPKGVIIGLIAKGKAKKDNTGFVVRLLPQAVPKIRKARKAGK